MIYILIIILLMDTYLKLLPIELISIISNYLIYTKNVHAFRHLTNINEDIYFRNICINIYDYFKRFPVKMVLNGRKIRWVEIYEILYTFDSYVNSSFNK